MSQGSAAADRALSEYERLLRTRGAEIGAIGRGDSDRIRERHIEDSLRAADCIAPFHSQIVDLGSGGGLPGIPLAVVLADRSFTLIESRRQRAAFLELVVERLDLTNVRVVPARMEDVSLSADLGLARALAPAAQAWRLAERLLRRDGRLVYFAGSSWDVVREVGRLRSQGISAEICSPKRFKWQGPLVIMGRSSVTDGSHHYGPTLF